MDLLLAHGDDGRPVLDRAADPSTAAAEAGPVPRREPQFLADITADANDLVRQGWAVVVADGADGARLASLVQPLVGARAEDQRADVLTIRVPPDLDADAARQWKQTTYPALYGYDESRRPRYLLLLGDFDQISLDAERMLAQDAITGRLACTTDDGYAAYADKVLAWQRTPSPHERARAVFYTVHDGTAATTAGHAKLIQPCHDRCVRTARDKPSAFPASAIDVRGASTPDPGELLGLAATRHPAVLLSMSHGMGPPRRRPWAPSEAREHQGAMSFGTDGALGPRELAAAPFLPGGLWIYFACFGAGTPAASAYRHWLDMVASHGMPELAAVTAALHQVNDSGAFVSGLGKAVLANPDGPLALIGHLDLAWSYSYEELRVHRRSPSAGGGSDRSGDVQRVTGSNRSLNFAHLITKLVAGERAGAAALALKLQLATVGAELTAHYDRCKRAGSIEGATQADLLALGNLWMLHQDLLGYTLLGDPAVRLPLAGQTSAAARIAPVDVVHATPHDLRAPDADAIDRLERAVLAVASGESPGVIAAQLREPRSDVVEATDAYRKAGRAALSALLDQRRAQKGSAT